RGAQEIDASLRFDDRLTSALSLGVSDSDDPFVRLTVEQAGDLAAGARLGRAIPIRPGTSWRWWPFIAAAALSVGWFMEPMRLLRNQRAEADRLASLTARESARQDVLAAAQTLVPPRVPESPAANGTGGDAAGALEELAHKL